MCVCGWAATWPRVPTSTWPLLRFYPMLVSQENACRLCEHVQGYFDSESHGQPTVKPWVSLSLGVPCPPPLPLVSIAQPPLPPPPPPLWRGVVICECEAAALRGVPVPGPCSCVRRGSASATECVRFLVLAVAAPTSAPPRRACRTSRRCTQAPAGPQTPHVCAQRVVGLQQRWRGSPGECQAPAVVGGGASQRHLLVEYTCLVERLGPPWCSPRWRWWWWHCC